MYEKERKGSPIKSIKYSLGSSLKPNCTSKNVVRLYFIIFLKIALEAIISSFKKLTSCFKLHYHREYLYRRFSWKAGNEGSFRKFLDGTHFTNTRPRLAWVHWWHHYCSAKLKNAAVWHKLLTNTSTREIRHPHSSTTFFAQKSTCNKIIS